MKQAIKTLRRDLAIHTYLYDIGESIISDALWDQMAYRLVELQEEHPGAIGYHDEAFKDFDGHSGVGLPKDKAIIEAAKRALKDHQDMIADWKEWDV